MDPLRNGSDYYKKMLELQERLRRSEEERIRLEERFSMLEHESRSRHETCINRLRMRYIEFLEEQQARDERNHRLLGALDRVDSSLALMSAKTDRLGALRKQYETSMLSSYNNRANGGSMTGDSGVASQRDEKQRRSINVTGGNKNKHVLSDRARLAFEREKTLTRPADSFCQARYDPRYIGSWSGNRYEDCRTVRSPIGSARYPQTGSSPINKTGGSLSSCINSIDPRSLPNARPSIDRITDSQSSPAYDYHFKSSRFAQPEYSLRRPETAIYTSDWRDPVGRRASRDLANCAYDSIVAPSRPYDNASSFSRDSFQSKINSPASNLEAPKPLTNYSGSLKDQLLLASNQPYTRVTEILRQELGDEEEYAGSVVENELERYISKIRNLHRDADPQSVEEPDHEQNTSGDLLNVTLSDDGLDFSVEEKPRHRTLPQHLGNVLALAKDLADRTATSANNVAANVYRQETVDERREAGLTETAADDELSLVDPLARRAKEDTPVASEMDHRFTSVNPVLGATGVHDDEGSDETNKKFSSLAKNGFSPEIAKLGTELAERQCRDIEDVAKSFRNKRDISDFAVESRLIDKNELDDERLNIFDDQLMRDRRDDGDELMTENSACLRKLEDAYRVVNGEERETDDNLRDITEELEPWNLSALERRVQEIILNDEVQADYVRGKSDGADASGQEGVEQAVLDLEEKSLIDKNSMEDCMVPDETVDLKKMHENGPNSIVEAVVSLSDTRDENESSDKLERYDDSSAAIANQSIERSTGEHAEELRVEGTARATSDHTDNLVDPNFGQVATEAEKNYIEQEDEPAYPQGEYPQDSNAQYDYTGNERYQGDPDEQYQNYDPNNVQYEQDPSGQYQYDDQQYQPVYTEHSSAQQAYAQDSSAQQAYAQDSSAQQAYAQDLSAQQAYAQDSSAQQAYAQDSNEAYLADTDRQYVEDPNQGYVTDANYEQYVADPNQDYSTGVDQQQYQQEQAYLQEDGGPYPASTADYVYPENQDYASAEVYDPNVQLEPNADRGYVDEQDATIAYESQSNFDDGPIEVPGDDRPLSVESEVPTVDHDETTIPQTEDKNPAKKSKDVIKSLLDSDTSSTIEINVSNTESDFDFN